jgi:hypothetical protein
LSSSCFLPLLPSAIQRSEVWVGIETPMVLSPGFAFDSPALEPPAGAAAAAGHQAQRQGGAHGAQPELLAHLHISSSRHFAARALRSRTASGPV